MPMKPCYYKTVPRDVPDNKKKKEKEMSVNEFKKWLMKFDKDKDGKISKKELRRAIRSSGSGFFSSWFKSRHGLSEADTNRTGFIEENEIDCLVDYAEKNMGYKFWN